MITMSWITNCKFGMLVYIMGHGLDTQNVCTMAGGGRCLRVLDRREDLYLYLGHYIVARAMTWR